MGYPGTEAAYRAAAAGDYTVLADEFLTEAGQLFTAKRYRDALPHYEKALECYAGIGRWREAIGICVIMRGIYDELLEDSAAAQRIKAQEELYRNAQRSVSNG